MRNSRLIKILILFGWFLLPGFCSSQVSDSSLSRIKNYWNPIFPAEYEKGLFRISLDIGKHHLTGLLFLKKTTDSTYRMVFSNEPGIRFFDLEFSDKDLTVHYIFPALDKKMLIKLLRKDFQALFFPFSGIRKIKKTGSAEGSGQSFKVAARNGKMVFTFSDSTQKITSIRTSGRIIDKMKIELDYGNARIPERITVINPAAHLTLKLSGLKR
jgi:hypothetical protein